MVYCLGGKGVSALSRGVQVFKCRVFLAKNPKAFVSNCPVGCRDPRGIHLLYLRFFRISFACHRFGQKKPTSDTKDQNSLTLNIILGIGIRRFVVVHHLHHMKKIVFS